MQVLETYSQGKPGAVDGGDDVVAVTPDFVAVFDGVTSRSRLLYGGVSSGLFAARTAARALRDAPCDVTAFEMVERLTGALADALAELAVSPVQVEGPATTMVAYSRHRREVWHLGSGHASVNGTALATTAPPSDRVVAEVRDLYLSELIAAGATDDDLLAHDPSHLLVAPLLANQWRLRNKPGSVRWSYGVIDGTPVPSEHVTVFAVPAAASVVLTSDGYVSAAETLAHAEAELTERASADSLLRTLRPTFMNVRGGALDDRSYIRVFHP